jgi:hypothetical protein
MTRMFANVGGLFQNIGAGIWRAPSKEDFRSINDIKPLYNR